MRFSKVQLFFFIWATGITLACNAMQQAGINTLPYQQQLAHAIETNDIATVQSLLQNGLNPNFKFSGDYGPWSVILFNAYYINPQIIQLLLDHGLDPNTIVNSRGLFTPLLYLLSQPKTAYARRINEEQQQARITAIIKILLANSRLNIQHTTRQGDNALMLAIGNNEILDLLLKNPNLNINSQNTQGQTALMRLVDRKNMQPIAEIAAALKLFFANPSLNINLTDVIGQTALDYAQLRKSNKTIVAALIEYGATAGNTERRKMPGGTYTSFEQPQATASSTASSMPSGPQPSATATSGTKYHARTAQPMPQMAAQPSAHGAPAYGYTPPALNLEQQIILAVKTDNVNAIDALFKAGANPNAISTNGTPIFFYALRNPNIVKFFLAQPQFNPNLQDKLMRSALSTAIQLDLVLTTALLLKDPRTDVNLKDSSGATALDYALVKKSPTLHKLLQERKAESGRSQMPPKEQKRASFTTEVYDALGVPLNANPYAILGVTQNASDDEVKKAYKSLSIKWHPDKNPDKQELAGHVFQLIAAAYQEIQKLRGK